MKALRLSLILLLPCFAAAQNIEDNPLHLDSLLRAHQNMHFYHSPTIGNADSVWHRSEHFYLYFDTDSICRQFIRKGGYNAIPAEMNYLYFAVFTEMTPQRRTLEIEKIEKIAKKYQSEALMCEVELQQVFNLPLDSEEQSKYRFERFRELQHQAEKRMDIQLQLRIREDILSTFYYGTHIFEAFEEAMDILHILDNITDEQFAGRRGLYFFIGELYYMYGYNEQAIPLLKNALKDSRYFFDRSNLQARNTLGLYYRGEGDLDASDRYFRSMLESPDMVQYRDEYDAIAICNLGKNYLLRKDYNKAEILLQKGLPVMAGFDLTFPLGVSVALGNCYMAQGKLQQTKVVIDSAQTYFRRNFSWGFPDMDLYRLMSKYYAATGDAKASAAYIDSTILRYNEYQKRYNISQIFQVEKKLYEAEKTATAAQLKIEKIEKQKYRNILILSFLVIILLIIFYTLYSRLRQQKIRGLYRKIKEQDRLAEELEKMTLQYEQLAQSVSQTDNRPVETGRALSLQTGEMQQQQIVYRLRKYILDNQNDTKIDIDRDELAAALTTNRTTLSNAVKALTGKTLMEYVNLLRLEKARQLLDSHPKFTVEAVAEACGFTYRTFYRLFKEHYNFSPAEYRRMGKEV